MALSQSDLEAIAAMIAAAKEQPTTKPQRATATAEKAAHVERNLSPQLVAEGKVQDWSAGRAPEGDGFVVTAVNGDGSRMFSSGARAYAYVAGKKAMSASIPLAVLDRLAAPGVLDQLRSAISKVNQRALLAEHQPTVDA